MTAILHDLRRKMLLVNSQAMCVALVDSAIADGDRMTPPDTELAALLKLAESEAAVYEREGINGAANLIRELRDRLRAATAAGEPDTRLGPDISPGIRYKCVLSLLRAYGMTTANAEKCLDDEDFVSWLKDTAPPEQGWRPIESAPRDGTKILVAVRGESTMVRWHEPAWLGAGGRCYQFDDPTHWMPPPPPPQQPDPEKQKQGREREVAESGVGRGQHGGGGES